MAEMTAGEINRQFRERIAEHQARLQRGCEITLFRSFVPLQAEYCGESVIGIWLAMRVCEKHFAEHDGAVRFEMEEG